MDSILQLVESCTGFQWDAGNENKNWLKHRVQISEVEEVLFNKPLLLSMDDKHSSKERRYEALGRTNANRLLAIVFTLRGDRIRPISARNMSYREREKYYVEGAKTDT